CAPPCWPSSVSQTLNTHSVLLRATNTTTQSFCAFCAHCTRPCRTPKLCREAGRRKETMSTETDRPASLAGAPCSTILCRSCGYAGEINTYRPSLSPYADCKCPQCGSTN